MDCIHWIIRNIEVHHYFWTLFFGLIAAAIALWQVRLARTVYKINSQFTRVSNLSAIWRLFYYDKDYDFIKIFVALEEADDGHPEKLKDIKSDEKFRFLAYLAEVVSFAEVDTVDKKKAINLFQWHFHHVFTNPKTYPLFWDDIGKDAERNSDSWKADMEFAEECKSHIDAIKLINKTRK